MKYLIKSAYALVVAVILATLIASYCTLPLVPVFISLFILSAIPQPGGAMKGTVLEVWASYIIERFWKDNSFLKFAYDDSDYVVQGRIVHIPQPGSKPAVVKNRATFPGTAVRRNDTDILYALDEYTTDPTHIPNIDAIHLSYNKQDSVLGDHMSILNETVADDMLIKWGSNSTVVKTTGDAVAPITGQTGNRKGFDQKDLKSLMVKMNANKVPKTDRYVLIDDNMYEYFYDSLGTTNAKDFSRFADVENGVVGKLHGFSIMTRSSVLATDNADAVKPLGAVLGAADNLASLAWQKNSVAFAMGDKKLFQDTNNPLYFGDIHSALVMAGGRVRRSDGQGAYIIEQGV
jgi:hypothetical protein